jgi:FkbM family methyltransferase
MSDFFDIALHHLGKTKKSENTALNIGAMDGVMFDEMIGYTNMYQYKVLYVEPIPYLFEKLKSNITEKNAMFENSAISDYEGEIEMMIIDKDAIDSGLVHPCFYGMSAVYPPKNGLGSEFDRETVEKYGKRVKVKCIKFEKLLKKHKINNIDIIKIDAEGHDYKIFKQINFKKYRPKVVRMEWVNLEEIEKELIKNTFEQNDYVYDISGQDIVGITKELHSVLFENKNKDIVENKNTENNITLVTGLWNLGRGEMGEGWSRSYSHYLEKFKELLQVKENLIIFGDKELEKFVRENRKSENTQFVLRSLNWFKDNEYFEKIQNIRTNSDWFNQVVWLSESTQAKLEYYNPLVMSKMFLLNDARIVDKFDSKNMFWIDAGLTNTVHPGYFTHDNVFDKLGKYINKFSFVCFPYENAGEIHGFKYDKLKQLAENDVKYVARGGFFGGPKNTISEINGIYYNLLIDTLSNGFMGTEESLFSIMCHKNSRLINYFEIDDNGLFGKFFEDLKNDQLIIKSQYKGKIYNDNGKVGIYVLTFNSPNQFKTLIDSMLQYDEKYIKNTTKFLLDNSTDESTYDEYKSLCEKFGFEHIKKDNLGICGGRQFIAEHFDASDLDYMVFFEDDMFFYPKHEECKNGFKRFDTNLFDKTLQILKKEDFDFLKFNYTEFYGDNGTQWAWYNVPQAVREKVWPSKNQLPKQGTDPDAPKTNFSSIKSHDGIPYVSGEIYYCNWPHLVSKEGNKKMFIDTTWAHPYEQTWMSHMFQLTLEDKLNGGLLLMTPTEHNRFDHYPGFLRKES